MRALAVLVAASISAPVAAAPAGYFDLLPGVALESGDSWTDAGTRYHLYGVQACLRGTSYTDRSGKSDDCGEASLAVLAAFIADTRPTCAPVATITNVTHVVCYASVGVDRLDLGNLMITSGYAFAACVRTACPILPPMLSPNRSHAKSMPGSGNSRTYNLPQSCSVGPRREVRQADENSSDPLGLAARDLGRPPVPLLGSRCHRAGYSVVVLYQ